MWIRYDPNPVQTGRRRGDCVLRALTIATGKPWDTVYWELCHLGRQMGDWGNANDVWRKYLRDHGYFQYSVPNTCPVCYTIRDFCLDYPHGVYIVCTGARDGDHVVAVKDGNFYDSWDSGDEIPVYYFTRRDTHNDYSHRTMDP